MATATDVNLNLERRLWAATGFCGERGVDRAAIQRADPPVRL
ncbi:MAG TPA: hypothetical protein VFN74_13415 [Chloroflexota bacterium]|nr:hypothetical protein [Chloroflexota bacterium]